MFYPFTFPLFAVVHNYQYFPTGAGFLPSTVAPYWDEDTEWLVTVVQFYMSQGH